LERLWVRLRFRASAAPTLAERNLKYSPPRPQVSRRAVGAYDWPLLRTRFPCASHQLYSCAPLTLRQETGVRPLRPFVRTRPNDARSNTIGYLGHPVSQRANIRAHCRCGRLTFKPTSSPMPVAASSSPPSRRTPSRGQAPSREVRVSRHRDIWTATRSGGRRLAAEGPQPLASASSTCSAKRRLKKRAGDRDQHIGISNAWPRDGRYGDPRYRRSLLTVSAGL
jgi:hypothetical protein